MENLARAAKLHKTVGLTVRQEDKKRFTCGLVVQSHHVTAGGPQRVGVVVGRFHALAFGVDSTERFTVVEEEVSGATLPRRLCLDKRADLFVGVVV